MLTKTGVIGIVQMTDFDDLVLKFLLARPCLVTLICASTLRTIEYGISHWYAFWMNVGHSATAFRNFAIRQLSIPLNDI